MSTAKSIEHSTHSCENHLVSYIRIASQEGQEIDREHMNIEQYLSKYLYVFLYSL